MALVQMKCPNCGGLLDVNGSQFSCSHCGTIVLNIAEQQIDADIATIGVEEFTQKLQAAQNKFVIRLDEKVQVFDVDTAVTNKKIDDARALLAKGEYDAVAKCLSGVSSKILSAERLRFLAEYKARSEEELMFDEGGFATTIKKERTFDEDDVDEADEEEPIVKKGRSKSSHFANIIARCDPETKATYLKIQEVRVENERIAKEIREGYRLLGVKLYKEALIYANNICQKYPYKSKAWDYMAYAKRKVQENYVPEHEQEMMQICPDYQRLSNQLSEKPQEKSTESKKVERFEPDGTTTFGFETKCAHCGEKAFVDMASFCCPSCQHEITNEQIEESRAVIEKNKTMSNKNKEESTGLVYVGGGLLVVFLFIRGIRWLIASGDDEYAAGLVQSTRIWAYVFVAISLISTLVIQCKYRQKGDKTLHWKSSSRTYNLLLLIINIVVIAVTIVVSINFS